MYLVSDVRSQLHFAWAAPDPNGLPIAFKMKIDTINKAKISSVNFVASLTKRVKSKNAVIEVYTKVQTETHA